MSQNSPTLGTKRALRLAIQNSGLDPQRTRARWRPYWARFVELTAPCVFVHIRKAGGTSMAHAVGMHGITHSDAAQWRDHIGTARFDRRFRFALVRHPIDRVISRLLWKMVLQRDFAVSYESAAEVADAAAVSERINAQLRADLAAPTFSDQHSMRQKLSIDGELAMSYVGKLETLDESLDVIARHTPLDRSKMKRLKAVGDNTKKQVVLEHDLFQEACERLREDFEAFDYDPAATRFQVAAREI